MLRQSHKRICLGAFLLPVLLFAAVMFLCRIHPFGERTLILWDADGQYLAFLTHLRRILQGEADAFYTLSKAAGGSMAGLTAYYLASPLNWVLALFPAQQMITAFHLLVLIKIGLAGLTACVALQRHERTGWAGLLFSTGYALMGYMACYFWNIMWIDGVILLPLIASGINDLLQGKSALKYCVWLAVALWSNYYIGYMLCLFSVLWFAYGFVQNRLNGQSGIKSVFLFAISSLLAGGLAAAMLLPAFCSLNLSGSSAGMLSLQSLYPMAEIATKLFTGAIDFEQIRYGLPNIFIGIPLLALFGSYALNPSIPRPKRIASAALLGVFLLSFQMEGLYLLWHGLDAPNALPARFSFLFSFLLIFLAYEGYCRLNTADHNRLSSRMGYLALAFSAGTCLLFSSGLPSYLAYETVVFDVVCFLCSCGLIALFKGKRKRLAFLLLFAIQLAGLVGNLYFSIHRLDSVDTLRADSYHAYTARRQATVERIKETDPGLYRMETNDFRTENDPLTFGYYGLSHFSSDFDPTFASFVKQIGLHQSYYRIQYAAGTTPVLESLFGVKYIIHHEDQSLTSLPESYQKLWQDGEESVWRNPYALPLAFVAGPASDPIALGDDPFENQNLLMQDLTGLNEPIFRKVSIDQSGRDEILHAVFEQPADTPTYLSTDGGWFSLNEGSFEKLGRFIGCVRLPDAEQSIQTELRVAMDASYSGGDVYVSTFDEAAFERAYTVLVNNGCQIECPTDSHLLIQTPDAAEPMQLVLSLPYDEGWEAFVDGKKASTSKRYDALLAIDLPSGSHNVELRFTPVGWTAGVAVSVGSLFILLAWIGLNCRRRFQK